MDKKYEKLIGNNAPKYFSEALKSIRKKGSDDFLEKGFPNKFTEGWRKFDLNKFLDLSLKSVSKGEITKWEPKNNLPNDNLILVHNGVVKKEYHNIENIPEIKIVSNNVNDFPVNLIGSVESNQGTSFYDLNSATFMDALSITTKQGQKYKPLEIRYCSENSEDGEVVTNRTVIEVKEDSNLVLVQNYSSINNNVVLNNSVTEIILHKGSSLNHVIISEEGSNNYHINQVFIKQGEASHYKVMPLSNTVEFSRYEFQIFLEGDRAKADLSGLHLGCGRSVFNSDVTIHHRAKNCSSSSKFKGIGSDNALGVYRGLVYVYENGSGTNAHQGFHSLALSENSRICNEPHLIIQNDDVSCSHGATVGQLDKKQLFYLESRGVDPVEAKKMLIKSFAADALTGFGSEFKKLLLDKIITDVDDVIKRED